MKRFLLIVFIFSMATVLFAVRVKGQTEPFGDRKNPPPLRTAADLIKEQKEAEKAFRKRFPRNVPYCPNYFADVTRIDLSSPVIFLFRDESRIIDVSTAYRDPEGDVVTFSYLVSAGRIVGDGANVKWDLSGVMAGTYTISAGVSDGCGICGATKTRRVEIIECAGCMLRETD